MIQNEFLNLLKDMGFILSVLLILEVLFVVIHQNKMERRYPTKVALPDHKKTSRTYTANVYFHDIFHRRRRKIGYTWKLLAFEKSQKTGRLRPQLWRDTLCIVAYALFCSPLFSVFFAAAGCSEHQIVIVFFLLLLSFLLLVGIPYTVLWLRGYKAIQRVLSP